MSEGEIEAIRARHAAASATIMPGWDAGTAAGWASAHADRARLLAHVEGLERDLRALIDRTEPEVGALHYDACPYRPYADLPRWEEPEETPACTCSQLHMAVYWKSRWMLAKGWRDIAETRADNAEATAAREIAALKAALCALLDSGVELDHPALDYVTVQMDRGDLTRARALLNVTQQKGD